MRQPLDPLKLVRRVLAGHWILIVSCFVLIAAPVTSWALFVLDKTYEASATIFIDDKKGGAPSLLKDLLGPNDAELQMAVLKSRSLAEGVLEALSRESVDELLNRHLRRNYISELESAARRMLRREPPVSVPRTRALGELQGSRVRVSTLKGGEVEVRATAFQPLVAMDIANTYIEVLRQRSRSFAREEARATREFLDAYLSQTKSALQEAEDALNKSQGGRGAVRLTDRATVQMSQLATVENTLSDVQTSKEIARARLAFLKGGKPVPPDLAATVPGRSPLDQARERLALLEEKLATLRERYTEQHPAVIATLGEIREVQGRTATSLQPLQEPRAGDPARLGPAERAAVAKQMADLEVEVASLEAREQVLRQRAAVMTKAMSNVSAGEMEAIRLMRGVDTQRNLVNTLSEKLGTLRMQEQSEGRGIKVIDMAALPNQPSSSPVNRLILLGVALGLGLGVALGAIIEYVTQPIETEDELAGLSDVPVLGWVPVVERIPASAAHAQTPINFFDDPERFAIALEGCRTVRTALDSMARERPLRTIMIASTGPREGKSTILLNLALAFREGDRRVVVVDSDLRRPALHRALRSHAEVGIADVLMGQMPWANVIRPIGERLGFVPAGAVNATNPGALLTPDRVEKLLSVPREPRDLVMFDSAPVMAVSDNLVLGSRVDGVILVVRAGHTRARDLVRAQQRLEKLGAVVLGIVLNHVSPRDTRRYYTRYGEYYSPAAMPRSRWSPATWVRGRQPAARVPRSTPAATAKPPRKGTSS